MYVFIMFLLSVICLFLACIVFVRSKKTDATGAKFKETFLINLKVIFAYLGLAILCFAIAISQI